MVNGEVVFAAPWEGRVFAMAIQLSEQGHYSWAEFQSYLIAAVARWDAAHPLSDAGTATPYAYFELFAQALGRLLDDRGLLSAQEVAGLVASYRDRPHGHDHAHDHHHH